jgi:hypothetical protein
VSLLALVFTIFSFWWMNWRPGRLNVGTIRAFAAGRGVEGHAGAKNFIIVTLPLIVWNSGARPLLIEDLRLTPLGNHKLPDLAFEAVDEKLTTIDLERNDKIKRDYFFLPLALKPNEIVKANCVFEARKTNFAFEGVRYRLSLEARLTGSSEWRHIRELALDFSDLDDLGIFNLNELYGVFPYRQ